MREHQRIERSIGLAAYSTFARRYSDEAVTRPHNALYERPASLELIGDVTGMSVLDAGCGPGLCSAYLARNGGRVSAFDVTPEMVSIARARCVGLPVEVVEADLRDPLHWIDDHTVDKVLCSLVLDYVLELLPIFCEFKRVTRAGGTLVFSMAHPMCDWIDARRRGGGTYFDCTKFGLLWNGYGHPKPYVEAYRRPLAVTLNALTESGWTLDRFVEPLPQPQMKDFAPGLYDELSFSPAFMCIRARS
jgi:2-polyprenyl-6-hydroxyphenyl methylase/3-demethylubiquinone-9 3-methyltransferase